MATKQNTGNRQKKIIFKVIDLLTERGDEYPENILHRIVEKNNIDMLKVPIIILYLHSSSLIRLYHFVGVSYLLSAQHWEGIGFNTRPKPRHS